MSVLKRRGWNLPERLATPEALVFGRRSAIGLAGATVAALGAPSIGRADGAGAANPKYPAGRPLTSEKQATTFNNYYEFGSEKNIWQAAQKLQTSPWSLKFDGMVKTPRTIGLDDLLKQVKLEERVYRHRCVEAWAMTVPWTGFPLAELVRIAEPLGSAKYVRFETKADDAAMPGLREVWYPWPYTEGVTIEEAGNEVAFLATGLYGKPLPPQNGGPIRVVLPWKYGFKSAKAIVKVTFTDKRPETYWNKLIPNEYGFWANVNPAVAHPRWSQATERLLGSEERVPTQLFNGYGEFVAKLYADKQGEALFI